MPSEQVSDVMASFRLDERVAIVTGAGQGLGRGMAIALAQAGANVAVLDVDEESANTVAREIQSLGRQALAAEVDVRDGRQVQEAVTQTVSVLGAIHILVNNAGVTTNSPFENLDEEDWDRVLGVNLTGIYHCSKWVARQLIQQDTGGSIINIASMSGLIGNRGGNNSHYCATKGGVIALTRSLAVEWARHSIRVNAIAPGYSVTPMTGRLKQRDPAFYQELIDRVPLGRFGNDEDMRGAVVYLASKASAYVSGHTLVIDGGYTAW
jgi:2-deoxy-D-gluconate 3-dehydrogenase